MPRGVCDGSADAARSGSLGRQLLHEYLRSPIAVTPYEVPLSDPLRDQKATGCRSSFLGQPCVRVRFAPIIGVADDPRHRVRMRAEELGHAGKIAAPLLAVGLER